MSDVIIRTARLEDAEGIGHVHVAAWQDSYRGIVPERLINAYTPTGRARRWSEILTAAQSGGGALVRVAEANGEILGFGCAGAQRDAHLAKIGYAGEVSALYLHSSARGRGLGRRLMRKLMADLLAQGHGSMALWVLKGNDRARAFYWAMGGMYLMDREDEERGVVLYDEAYGWSDLEAALAPSSDRASD
ncbi:MAG: GNAT family N-acetyltransferase [Pseudomonadota bacterium]